MNQAMVGKPPKPGEYLCAVCDGTFRFKNGVLRCPECGNNRREDLVPIFVKEVKEEELMHTEVDFPGG